MHVPVKWVTAPAHNEPVEPPNWGDHTMHTTRLLLAACLSLGGAAVQAQTQAAPAASPAPEAGVVSVSFSPQGRFFDAGETRYDGERTQTALDRHFQAMGKRWLPPGARLRVDITEIDLAGRVPMGRLNNPRLMSGGADWPRIALSYELTRSDGGVESGKESLSDMDYLMMNGGGLDYRNDTLMFEKRMLDEWFQRRFAPTPG
jgi:hypothetical protein